MMSKITFTERRSCADESTAVGMMDLYAKQTARRFTRENAMVLDTPPVVRYYTRSDGLDVVRVYPARGFGCKIDVTLCVELSTLGVDGDTVRMSLLDVSGGPSQEYVTVTVPNRVNDYDVWEGAAPLKAFLHDVAVSTYKRKSIDSRGVHFSTARVAYAWCCSMCVTMDDDMSDELVVWPRSAELVMRLIRYWLMYETDSVRHDISSDGDVMGLIVSGEGREDLHLSLPAGTYHHLNRVLAWYVQGMCLDTVTVPYTLDALKAVVNLWQTTDTAPMIQRVIDSDVYDAAPVEKGRPF